MLAAVAAVLAYDAGVRLNYCCWAGTEVMLAILPLAFLPPLFLVTSIKPSSSKSGGWVRGVCELGAVALGLGVVCGTRGGINAFSSALILQHFL